MMLVFTFDYGTGALTGARLLGVNDIDPRSTDTMLVPGNATREVPPRCGKGLWPFWKNGRWEVYELVDDDPPPPDYFANL